jgi:hypothetical protein
MIMLLLALQTPDTAPALRLNYRIVSRTTIDLESDTTSRVTLISAFVTIAFTDSAGGRIARALIDSATFEGASAAAPVKESAAGITLRGFFVNGSTAAVTPSTDNLQAAFIAPALRLLMAGTHRGGASWIDSTTGDTATAAAKGSGTTATRWTPRQPSDGSTLHLDGATTGSMALSAGADTLRVQADGTSTLTVKPGQLPTAANSSTAGRGTLAIAGRPLLLKLTNEIAVTLFWPRELILGLMQIP